MADLMVDKEDLAQDVAQSLEEQIEYLEQAKDIVLEYQDAVEEAREEQEIVDKLEADLTREREILKDKIQTAVKKRRGEIESGYEKQIKKIKNDLDRAKRRLNQAREKAVESRVADATREHRVEKTGLATELHTIYKKEGIPVICRNSLYFALHYPGTLKEILVLLAYILLCYGALPAGIIYFFTNRSPMWMGIVILLDILVWGGIYLTIHLISRRNHKEALGQIRQIRNKIHDQKKQISRKEKAIRRDKDDSQYDLEEYQANLKSFQDAYDRVQQERKEALALFEKETKEQIQKELTDNSADRIQDLEKKLEDSEMLLADLRSIEQDLGRRMQERFVNVLGKEFLNADRLDALMQEFRNGAANMMEAQERVLTREASGK